MPKEVIQLADVVRALSQVSDPYLAFWFNNGVIVKSLKEMAGALETVDNDVFHYHVNKDKNDIYNWVVDVFADDSLASRIRQETNRREMARKIRVRIRELEKEGRNVVQQRLV
jgi:hypothetical protein